MMCNTRFGNVMRFYVVGNRLSSHNQVHWFRGVGWFSSEEFSDHDHEISIKSCVYRQITSIPGADFQVFE